MKEIVFYSPEIAKEICDTIACTAKGLRKLCAENPHWPAFQNIHIWCQKYPEFRELYARAKVSQVEWLVEDALEIAYDGSKDSYVDDKGNERQDHEWVARSRLKVDTIKWFASKLAPKIYGDRIHVDTKSDTSESDIAKAKEFVAATKADNYGRSTNTEN